MPMLRCAFWLSFVYASILLHPAASTGRDAVDAVTDAVRDPGALAGARSTAWTMAATLATLCARRANACGDAALEAARNDAAELAALFASAAPDFPAPLTGPRRHARARGLTQTPRPCKGGCEPVTDAR